MHSFEKIYRDQCHSILRYFSLFQENYNPCTATQEEMQRKTQEYETIIEELRAQIG